ncbi:MAG TPA: right-handed parallel beta-helix repeat-containing protein, partial [Polyangiaceae bacterium]
MKGMAKWALGLVFLAACSTANKGAGGDHADAAGDGPSAALDGGAHGDASVPPADGGADVASDAPVADGGGGACTAEEVTSCNCSQGIGTRRCLADGSSWGACTCATYGAQFAVSPQGDDSAAGTLAAPFKTLERAQTAVRALVAAGPLPAGGVVVWLRGGIYPRTATFALTSLDSGQANAPVVYRGYPGETARVVGGVSLDPASFHPVASTSPVWSRLDPTAQGTVVAADLTSLGIDYGTLQPRGVFVSGVPAALELFIDGQRAPLGRWPDADEDDPAGAPPNPLGTQVTVYGTGLVPDVSGLYVKDSVQDGVSSFTRQGLVGGKAYHLYRVTTATWVAWFLTTSTTGYPSASDPFFYTYQSDLGPLSGAQGATGTPAFVDPTAVIDGFARVATASASSFTLTMNRTARWTHATDAWVHGFFAYPWADNHLPVASVDPSSGTIAVTGSPYDGTLKATVQGGGPSPVYAYNLLEEISEPGEWYLDRTSGLLYLWPPANLAQHDLVVSSLAAPLVTVTGASHVVLQEVTLEASREQLLVLKGGSSDVRVVGCTLRDAGESAAQVVDGTDEVFDGDLFYAEGEDGVDLGGGDRASLTPGKNVVQNSVLHDYGQWVWSYTPAVNLSGDGNVVQHDVIYGSPHAAILFYGSSQHLIAYNDIHDVLRFTSDAGAIYAYSDWGAYGNLIEYNYIHDLATKQSGFGIHGIYLDGCLSGPTATGNVLANVVGQAIFHNGGHDVTMTNNVVYGSTSALVTTA